MSSDIDRQIEQLRNGECIKESEVKALCAKAREILVEESNVQRVDAPVTVNRSSIQINKHSDLRRHSRPVPRLDGALQGRRRMSGY